uniref:Enoyl reductase (ER) domain-containing protein n=1 Tax=Fagus sylvatica TaxID=28930 RepID=A0A2N9FVH1_FAGSY
MSGDGGEDKEHKHGEENMAAWLVGIKTLKIEPYHLPPLGPHDVKVQVKALGICGSDVHHFKNMRCANFIVKKPMVIGHECAGITEEVGSQVKNLAVVHPAYLCFKLPDNVSLEEGAMCEPLSVGVHACRRASISPETNVLILGAGPIGLVVLLAARAFGAPRIVIVDVDDCRLSIAKNLGADETIQVSTNIQDVGEEVVKIQSAMGSGIDVSFDCVGFDKTMSTALNATRPGGKVCLIGLPRSETTVPLTPAAVREVDVIGIFRYRNTWPLCIEFLKTGKIDIKPLITHRFGFSQQEVEDAFETSARGGSALKVMFNL